MEYKNIQIQKLPHSGFQIKSPGTVIYIDPFTNDGEISFHDMEDADYIFVSHEHFDHCENEAIKDLMKENTWVIGNKRVIEVLNDIKVTQAVPGSSLNFDHLLVQVIPAYNLDKFRVENILYHPKENEGVGYVIELNGIRIYHTGDSDFTVDMKQVSNIDIMLVPISGTYVMTTEEAAEAVKFIAPKIAIPMHINAIIGGESDVEKFEELLKDSRIEIVRG